jgi:lipoic acid synthetase
MKVPYRGAPVRDEVRKLLQDLRLHTVCESARCPNQCDCWARGTATFLILGNTCTRNCRFCAVHHGAPGAVEADEPARVAEAVKALGIKFAVITSVTRDDLPDGGAAHFAATIRAVREAVPGVGVEVLTPDFGGREADIATVLAAEPDVFNHNMETCARLTAAVRSGAEYARSLRVLATAARLAANHSGARTLIKSGFMLGMGETGEEIRELLRELRAAGVQILTIGQYLPPSAKHWPLERYVTPEEFERWGVAAREEFGFAEVVSRPLVRSSFLAEETSRGLRRSTPAAG